ncbi:ankyrin repeat domain-containing protein 12-like isoform X4 [Mytilus californianus]|uniref:ankyrin repeat domain-containing protein 12-like isoform X4 n=1 Tax=Mytilus californianus TaxID=6549 RepID=UPI0022452E4F|nr:ankyrin repeat domain-containing protein 12-like isoform X4 [Mytilus californianus]
MREEICIIFIMILTCSLAFNLSCPEQGQWNYRATANCFGDLNKYTCLLDATKTRYTETCDGSRDEIEGHKSTINRNNFDTTKCRPERFQPIDFTTVGNSDCVFQKSKCVQEGQIISSLKNDSSLEDTKCLCDYTKGYSFINVPKDKCYCNPSVDDCSCYREFCPSGKKLSPDYQCSTEIDMKKRTWNCLNIAFADDGKNDDQVRLYIEDIDPKNGRPYIIAAQVIVPIIVVIMVVLLIWCWKTTKSDKIVERIKRLVYEKDDNNESEAIILPTEISLSSHKNDQIQFESTLLRHRSDSITSVPDNCSSMEEIKLLQTDDRTTALIWQTNQNDTSVPKDVDTSSDGSFMSAKGSTTGLNEIEDNKSVINDSTETTTKSEMSKLVFQNGENDSDIHSGTYENEYTDDNNESEAIILPTEISLSSYTNDEIQVESFEKERKDKGDDSVEEICTVEAENERTSTKEHKDQRDESDEEICIDEAKNIKSKENEELYTFEKEHTDKSNEPVEEIGNVEAENKKTSKKEHKDKKDESVEEICIDETENIKIKESEELNMSKSKFETDDADKSVNTETPDITVNITEENFDSLLEGFEESEPTEHESADSDTDKRTAPKNRKSDD